MSNNMFKTATREQAKLRVGIEGPAKSGKTFTALILATAATQRFGGRIAFIDTERGSASKYAPKPGQTADSKFTFDFDVVEFDKFGPTQFINAIENAQAAGYTVLIADSLSHEWMGTGGVLQMVEAAPDQNRYAAWRTPSMLHTKLIDAMLQSGLHVIATMRSKMAYDQVEDEKTGKKKIVKLGLQPVQRDGMEYEFDVVFSMDVENNCRVTGSRCPDMENGLAENRPGGAFFVPLLDWVSEGGEPTPRPKPPKSETAALPTGSVAEAQARYHDFLEKYGISGEAVLKALGSQSVGKWLKANPGKTLDDAIQEVIAVMGLGAA